jgi:hypothetical protein
MSTNFPTLILNFDDVYTNQNQLLSVGKVISINNITQVRYICSYEKLEEFKKLIPFDYKGIKFLGKSDFHYLTYLFIRNIKIPFELVVIDHHLDFKETFDGYISCGSWIRDAIKLPFIEKVVVVTDNENVSFKDNLFRKLKIIKNDIDLLKKYINFPIYISIDKDILDKKYISTNWEQGTMDLDSFINIISFLCKYKILGIDVCGEPDFNLIEIRKSEKINLLIHDIFRIHTLEKITA